MNINILFQPALGTFNEFAVVREYPKSCCFRFHLLQPARKF